MKEYFYRYCPSTFYRDRLKTIEVKIGNIKIGADNPIAIQSMTNTNPMDTEATVNQIINLSNAGCDIVRLAIPNIKSAHNLSNIQKGLLEEGYSHVPLVADVHYSSAIALIVADKVEKVRINPGNYCEKITFENKSYSKKLNKEALIYIENKFKQLIEKARLNNTAIRIGVNHGSLSERILSRFGNTVEGMVESAMEYLQIAQQHDFDNIVFSMKSSSTKIMVEAYRMLVIRMYEFGKLFPLHLGVTEAGSDIEGRIKSGVGIGALLIDGLGDTIRVSLTEPPENEIPAAKSIISFFNHNKAINNKYRRLDIHFNNNTYNKQLKQIQTNIKLCDLNIGKENPKRVEIFFDKPYKHIEIPERAEIIGLHINKISKMMIQNVNPDKKPISVTISKPDDIAEIAKYINKFEIIVDQNVSDNDVNRIINICKDLNKILQITFDTTDNNWIDRYKNIIPNLEYNNIILGLKGKDKVHSYRILNSLMRSDNKIYPLNIKADYKLTIDKNSIDCIMKASIEIGCLLLEGIGDIITLNDCGNPDYVLDIIYNILQASEVRVSKAIFISCPSCGRTNFNIEKTTNLIKKKTFHLKGLKIAIMGCTVNGPGEMGEVDFGYIGGVNNKVNLYVNNECVKRGINEKNAVDELINLIKQYGKWKDPD